MTIINCIKSSDHTAYGVVGDTSITWKKLLQDMNSVKFQESARTIVGIDGRSTIDNIVRFFSAIKQDLVPTMIPFKTGKVKDKILKERISYFNDLGINKVVLKDGASAFAQLSSGTTGNQKGFIISHEAIIKHCQAYAKNISLSESSTIVSWLPLTHDMGLITSLFLPIVTGARSIIIPTEKWVMNYESILDAIEDYQATHVWFPNFCFELLANLTKKERDLSNTMFVNCSEPAKQSSIKKFQEKFKAEKVYSCYAMAENVFAVTQASENEKQKNNILSSGLPISGVEIKLDDSEILIKSEFLFDKILKQGKIISPELEDGFYRTGDVGEVNEEGEVFVLGRKKDVAIVRGKNILLTDLDFEVSKINSVKPGRAASVAVEKEGTEVVYVLYESKNNVDSQIKERVNKLFGISCIPYKVKKKTIIKTTSGKIAREKNKEYLLNRQTEFNLIKSFLRAEEIYVNIDETTSLRSSGLLDSFKIFELVSYFHTELKAEIDWEKDYSNLDFVEDFINEFRN